MPSSYYPLRDNFHGDHPGTRECWSHVRRPVNTERGEVGEWVLVDGVPSTCTNIGLFTGDALFGAENADPIDLVLSGPNFGRNTGAAFSVSSGTLGAALAGSLCNIRSIALSFCHFMKDPPTLEKQSLASTLSTKTKSSVVSLPAPPLSPDAFAAMSHLACKYSVDICQQLLDAWDSDIHVQSYSMNVPIAETLKRPQVYWTRIWPSRHVQLYPQPSDPDVLPRVEPLGVEPKIKDDDDDPACAFLEFRPNLALAMCPPEPEPGTDVWAISNGNISISRLVASFGQVEPGPRPPPTVG